MFFRHASVLFSDAEEGGQPASGDASLSVKVSARRGLMLYFVLLLVCSVLSNSFALISRSSFSGFFIMWSPGIAALLTRLLRREGWDDISLRFGRGRSCFAIVFAAIIPAIVALIAYGTAWLTHLAQLVPFHASPNMTVALTFLGKNPAWPVSLFLLLAMLVSELFNAAGEELGWRGYMLTRLIDAGVPRPVLVSGLIWSFWHWPLIFLTAPHFGLPLIFSACIFLTTITSLGYLEARLRLQTGSIWPSIVLHAAWNSWIVELFSSLSGGGDTSHWIGESGILVALVMIIVATFFWRGNWKIRRSVV
ncbi:CPBP family intramembrane glutamic endopeptidase [Dictyobacter arantiisoli]|uniref:CAAX prenyl protease 2/Lysostaphin resistance protein A-like domain-containing protein n=1 Tax=Dictyobacter arantiisoli TaxID=2014874 RepID=A0A5A5T6W8_9CHLR|nr:CPBP family intramembrane glutamic endopeptidase [Dictyobacter arantiisoli]GCF06926.1 hypothetical protein KDI_04900 [Dictyobacter arantiisoli]